MTTRRKGKRKRNPSGWDRFHPSTTGLLVAGAVVVVGTALTIKYLREPAVVQSSPRPTPIPRPKPDHPPPILMPTNMSPSVAMDSGIRYGTSVTISVPEGGESYDVVVRPLAAGETIDVTIQARISTVLTVGDLETCLGVTLGARAAMSPDGGIVLNRTSEGVPGLCQETLLWSVAPAASIEFDGMDLVLRIDAPALEGAYDMIVALSVIEKPV